MRCHGPHTKGVSPIAGSGMGGRFRRKPSGISPGFPGLALSACVLLWVSSMAPFLWLYMATNVREVQSI